MPTQYETAFKKIGPGIYQLPMRNAGETMGVLETAGAWRVVHPRADWKQEPMTFVQAKRAAVALARSLNGLREKPRYMFRVHESVPMFGMPQYRGWFSTRAYARSWIKDQGGNPSRFTIDKLTR
jgi:hypothetical protein